MLPSYALYLFRIFKEQPMFWPDPKIRSKCAHLLLDSADILRDRVGGAERDRTDDLLLAKQALSQLSYSPFRFAALPGSRYFEVVGLDGFEPSTPALSRRCSNQLSYRPRSTQVFRLASERQPIGVDARELPVISLERR